MSEPYYKTHLKTTERPVPALQFAVLDDHSRVVAYCVTEDRAELLIHALNEYAAGSAQAEVREVEAPDQTISDTASAIKSALETSLYGFNAIGATPAVEVGHGETPVLADALPWRPVEQAVDRNCEFCGQPMHSGDMVYQHVGGSDRGAKMCAQCYRELNPNKISVTG
jgi:hypothetical protein